MEYDNNMRGVMFKNDKEGNDNRPDYKGNIEINGVSYWLSGWIKTPNAGGEKFMSLSFQPKEQQPQQEQPPVQDSGELPF